MDALEQFLRAYKAKNKPATARETERLLRRHLMFDKPVAEITTADITKVIDKLSDTSSEQQHVFVAGRHLFRWFERRRVIQLSPLAGVDAPHRPVPRDRVLDGAEISKIYSVRDGMYGDIIRILILTGQRLGQITNLRGDFIDPVARTISWPATAMKGNRLHTIPYGDMTAKIIEARLVEGLVFAAKGNPEKPFSNFSNAKRRLDNACVLPHWTLHDLRRSVTTQWASLGVAPHVCERLLAHSSGVISGVTAIYNRHSYMDEMREAIAAYDAHLVKLLNA